ncbi:MAG: hypothetical protein ACI86M_000543 [Saprospiraceae bacterium]
MITMYSISMKINFNNLLGLFIIFCATISNAQNDHRLSINLTAGMSKTGSLICGDKYREFDITPTIQILKTSLSINNNYNFGIGYQINKSLLINGSIGVASYGFQYTGDVIASPINSVSVGGFRTQESYQTRLIKVNLSAVYQLNVNKDLSSIIQPGMSWYTNPNDRFRQILGINMNSNNFSASLFSGLKIPMISNILFVSVGVSAKMPLQNLTSFYDFDNQFHPYSIGLQTTISYRFWSKR